MKKLLASCAVVALMATPAFAQSTIDPTSPDAIPAEPTTSEAADPMSEFQPQTEVLPEELPAEPQMAEEVPPVMPDAQPVLEAEVAQEAEAYAETEGEPVVTAEVAPVDVSLEASVNEADLPEEYSTEDLNAVMLAQVNEVGSEIATLDSEADVWVTADGSPVDPTYAQEGQGDIDVAPEEESFVTPETEIVTPDEDGRVDNPLTNENPVAPEY